MMATIVTRVWQDNVFSLLKALRLDFCGLIGSTFSIKTLNVCWDILFSAVLLLLFHSTLDWCHYRDTDQISQLLWKQFFFNWLSRTIENYLLFKAAEQLILQQQFNLQRQLLLDNQEKALKKHLLEYLGIILITFDIRSD